MCKQTKSRSCILLAGLLGLMLLGLSARGFAAEAEGEDVFDVLRLAETVSGPGQFAFPLFAPIDLGSGYEDRIAPFVVLSKPAPNEVDVPVDSSVFISLADYGSGVDSTTVSMFLDDEEVSAEVSGGIDNRVDVTYRGAEPFGYAQEVRVAISAADNVQNAMPPNVFSFTTVASETRLPTIAISMNKTVFTDGQVLVLLVSLKNPTDRVVTVRGYVALGFGESLLFYPNFTPEPTPIELVLPVGFEMDPTVIWTAPLFGIPDGSYTWYGALEDAETGNLGQISSCQFEFVTLE